MCTARLFLQGLTSLHSNFTGTGSSPINHSWHQKSSRDTGLPDGEDCILLHSLFLT